MPEWAARTVRKSAKKEENVSVKNAQRLLRYLSKNMTELSPLLILAHDYPDPDALASAFALSYLAEKAYGIQSKIAYGGVIGRMENRAMVRMLRLPVHKVKSSDFKKYEHIALLDTQPGFDNNSLPKNRRATIVIDQHPSAENPAADLAIIDTDCGATCVIVGQALLLLKIEVPARVATALVYGILSDTLNFYRAHRFDIFQTYLNLLPYCDMRALAHIQNPTRSRKFFLTLQKSIQEAKTCRRLIVSHLGQVENPDLVSQIADFLLTYQRMHWALSTGRYRGHLHVSLRIARPTTAQAGEILRDVFDKKEDAGGRGEIAGGSILVGHPKPDHSWEEAEEELVQRLKKRLRIPVKSEYHLPFKESS